MAKKKSEKPEKPTIHTTISIETNKLLKKYSELKDDSGNKIFGNKSKVIEKGIQLLNEYYNPKEGDIKAIWSRAREDLNMVMVGKTTFLSYISGDYEKAFTENIAIDILEWYSRMSFDEMDVKDILDAIKDVWLAANYFYKIEIEVGSKGSYQMSFYHDMHNVSYSEFWGNYFNTLLHNQKNFEVEIFPRSGSLILRISPE